MKKFLLILLMAGLLLLAASPADAVSRYGTFTTQPIETTGILIGQDGNTMDYEVWVYGVTIFADAASSFIGLYDVDTANELNSITEFPRWEMGEPTQFQTTTDWFDQPKRFTDGIGAIISVGVGFVHYGPAPE